MQQLWGRKISDLALRDFLQILAWVAKKKGKLVVYIDRWFPSSKACSACCQTGSACNLCLKPESHALSAVGVAQFYSVA
jgi:transposase